MKKFLLCFLIFCMTVGVCDCLSNTSVNEKQSTEKVDVAEEKKTFKIGDEVFIKNNSGEYKFVITKVEETDERNQFSDKDPAKVVLISFDYENISLTDDLYISELNFKAYDGDNTSLSTYPANVKYPDSISAGRKSSGQIAYGLDSNNNYMELEYYDNMFFDSDCKIILEW